MALELIYGIHLEPTNSNVLTVPRFNGIAEDQKVQYLPRICFV